jgi:hypothetical protein
MILRTLGWLLVVVMVVSKIVLMAYTFKNTDKSVYTENSNNNKKTTVVLNISEKDFYDAYQYLFLAIFGVFLYSFCLLALSFLTNKGEGTGTGHRSVWNPPGPTNPDAHGSSRLSEE